jgi:hypothetical protein
MGVSTPKRKNIFSSSNIGISLPKEIRDNSQQIRMSSLSFLRSRHDTIQKYDWPQASLIASERISYSKVLIKRLIPSAETLAHSRITATCDSSSVVVDNNS